MSGIAGVWNLDGRPVEQTLLARMNAEIAHRGSDGDGYWREGPVGLAHQMFRITPESLLETQPLNGPAGTVIVFDGHLDNREEILGLVEGVERGAPDCALVLAAYRRYGDATPEKLNGEFSFAIWDPTRQQMLLARDAMGPRPLYYWRSGNTFLFASEIKPILAHPDVRTRPNEETLADWVLRFPGEDNRGTTFFEDVYSLPPSHQAVVTPRGMAVRRYWDFDKTRQIRLSSFEEYTEAFRQHFNEAVRRRLRSAGPVTISLSGGVDSSAVYCTAETMRRAAPGTIPELRCVHLAFPEGSKAHEGQYPAEIERMYGIQIQRIPAVLAGPIEGVEEEIRRQESPFLTPQWAINDAYQDGVKKSGARLMLHGSFADEFLARDGYLADYVAQGEWRKLWNCWRRHPKSFRKKVPYQASSLLLPRNLTRAASRLRQRWSTSEWETGLYTEAFLKRIRERERTWKAFPGPFASAHAKCLYRQARSKFFTFTLECVDKRLAHQGMEARAPFLDRDLWSFAMAIPGEVVSGGEFTKNLLRSAMRKVLPQPIAERRDKTNTSVLVNPVFRQIFETRFLHQLHARGPFRSFPYVDEQLVNSASARDFSTMQGRGLPVARKYCDVLGVEVWLNVFS